MKHADLIARLEKLTGPSYAMEVEIALATGCWPAERIESVVRHEDDYVTVWFTDGPELPLAPNVTASIDAAVALVERMLPGWCWDVGSTHRDFLRDGEHTWGASLAGPVTWKPDEYGYDEPCYSHIEARGAIPAIALVIALLRALQESDPAAKDEA